MTPAHPARRARAVLVVTLTALAMAVLWMLHSFYFRRPPTVRDHALVFQRMEGGQRQLSTGPMAPASAAAMLVATVGRGDARALAQHPTLANGQPLQQVGATHAYARWPSSGTAAFVVTLPSGADAPALNLATDPADEATLAAVLVDGKRMQDVSWTERPAAWRVTSAEVKTTGPATLVAFWWGDAGVRHRKRVVPGDGFTLLGGVLESGALVQAAVAVKHVRRAGTHTVTWTAWPRQGAQLWLMAIE